MKTLQTDHLKSNGITGGKYCGKCEYYVITSELFCECCGMRLRASPARGEYNRTISIYDFLAKFK
jgi:hypothetical protein